MRTLTKTLLAAAAAVALSFGVAEAKEARAHVMTVRAPDGQIIEVHYTGDVAPRIVFAPRRVAPAAYFSPNAAFADFDRIAAAMDQRMALMMRQAQVMAHATPQQLQQISTAEPGFCMQSVRVTQAAGQAPVVERRSYGNCGGGAPSSAAPDGATRTAPAPVASPTPRRAPELTQINAHARAATRHGVRT